MLRTPTRSLGGLLLLAVLSAPSAAHALRVPSSPAPVSVETDATSSPCVVYPTVAGDCAALRAKHPEALGQKSGDHLVGSALMQYVGGGTVALSVSQLPRGDYGPGIAQANALAADLAKALGGITEPPVVDRVGSVYDPTSLLVHIRMTRTGASPMTYETYAVFGKDTLTMIDFASHFPAAWLHAAAARVMATLTIGPGFERDTATPRSPAEALGMLIGYALPFVLAIVLVMRYLRRRQKASTPRA